MSPPTDGPMADAQLPWQLLDKAELLLRRADEDDSSRDLTLSTRALALVALAQARMTGTGGGRR